MAEYTKEKAMELWGTEEERWDIYLPMAKNFTRAYKEHLDDHVAVREAYCLREQYPALCRPIKDGDLFAGRRHYRPLIGFSQEQNLNKNYRILADPVDYEPEPGDEEIRKNLGISNGGFTHNHWGLLSMAYELPEGSPERAEIEEMVAFWDIHSTRRRYNDLLPEDVQNGMGRTTGYDTYSLSGFVRTDCYSLDYDKLLRLGLPGLKDLITRKREETKGNADAEGLYTGMLMALDIVTDMCRHYQDEALDLLGQTDNDTRREQLQTMADTLYHVTVKKPETLRQAIQLFWMYTLVADMPNYGRTDIYLGDFYAGDIDNGRLTETEAEVLLCDLWKLIAEIDLYEQGHTMPNARLVIGGRGRRNEANADRFALAAMDVALKMRVNEPNVTLRFYDGQNPALMDKAVSLLGEGCIHPGLYNDDEHVPMVRDWHHVPEKDAEQYLPEGCGEILIDHMGFGSPNNIHIFPMVLDVVLHNGWDRWHNEQRGLKVGDLSTFDTLEKLMDAFKKQVDFNNGILARRHMTEHQAERESAAFLFASILSDDCIERGRALFDGGVRYLGGVIETFGLTNVADSLAAINELVYKKKVMTLAQLVAVTDANFEGYEKERKMMLACPKFGNDDDRVDAIHTELSDYVCKSADKAGREAGLDFFLNCNLNPGGSYYKTCAPAGADGRLDWDAMAMGNAPTAGKDLNSVTALLNSMAKHTKCHAGYVQNLKVNKNMFKGENRARFRALIGTYFKNGGIQLMVTALNADDLQNALKEPEKYASLQVRVAGWNGYFVKLSPTYQEEVLKRTMYESY